MCRPHAVALGDFPRQTPLLRRRLSDWWRRALVSTLLTFPTFLHPRVLNRCNSGGCKQRNSVTISDDSRTPFLFCNQHFPGKRLKPPSARNLRLKSKQKRPTVVGLFSELGRLGLNRLSLTSVPPAPEADSSSPTDPAWRTATLQTDFPACRSAWRSVPRCGQMRRSLPAPPSSGSHTSLPSCSDCRPGSCVP